MRDNFLKKIKLKHYRNLYCFVLYFFFIKEGIFIYEGREGWNGDTPFSYLLRGVVMIAYPFALIQLENIRRTGNYINLVLSDEFSWAEKAIFNTGALIAAITFWLCNVWIILRILFFFI